MSAAPARYIMIGGFLGAGKTTAIARLAQRLTDSGVRVGLITNDQSSGLVDTAVLRSRGFSVEEITGGCFCCRFDSLQEAAERLSDESRPDVFLAEPVGSCTDLLATVSYPLRRIYGDRFRVAPLSVLVDPTRAARVLGLIEGRSFSPKVVYVYEKQLEEAEIIVVNKCDQIDDALRARLVAALERSFPRADVRCVSAADGTGLDAWFDRVLDADGDDRFSMELDYDRYADGEAELGWLNAMFDVSCPAAFDGNALLMRLVDDLRRRIDGEGAEIAHLKMTLDSPVAGGQLSTVSVVRSDAPPDLRESLLDDVPGGTLILNLRAEAGPARLSELVAAAVDAEHRSERGIVLRQDHEEHFRPARPVPTHRLAGVPRAASEGERP